MAIFDIQPITEVDVEKVAQIMSVRWDEPITWCLKETSKYLAQDAFSAGFCAKSQGNLVGIGLFSLDNEDVSTKYGPWLCLLWVEPEFRGNSLGIELTKKRMEHAKKFGYTEIYLDANDAVPYHLNLGWKEVGTAQRKNELLVIMKWDLEVAFH